MTKLDNLHFQRCAIEIVQANAFNIEPLINMRNLIFQEINVIEFELDAFNGLHNLIELSVYSTGFRNVHYKIFEPLRMTMENLFLSNLGTSINAINLIGGVPMTGIRTIKLVQNPFYRIIAVNTLTNMPGITWLHIYDCGTEVIWLGAFDHFGDTLEKITMYKNKLKTLPGQLFDHLKRLNVTVLDFSWNPWQCDCNILTITQKYGNIFHFDCREGLLVQNDCSRPQLTDEWNALAARECWRHYGTNALRVNFITAYRICTTEDRTEFILIRSRPMHFYILILSNATTVCVRIAAGDAALPLKNMKSRIGIQLIAILDPTERGQVSPLHLISFNLERKMVWLNESDRVWVVATLIGAYLICIIAGFLLGVHRVISAQVRACHTKHAVLVNGPKLLTCIAKSGCSRAKKKVSFANN